MESTNLKILKPSRKKRRPGDIFIFKIKENEFGLGRIISTSSSIGGFENVNLIYIYRTTTTDKQVIPNLSNNNLLIPPIGVNQKPWTLGYFEIIGYRELRDNDILPVHCFEDFTGRYYDDKGNILQERFEPCGENALNSYRTLDDKISLALGIEISPDVSR